VGGWRGPTEEAPARLEVTRETVTEILGDAGTGQAAGAADPVAGRLAGGGGDGAAVAAGLSTGKAKIEGLRSMPERLAERGWLAKDGPGLFTLLAGGAGRAGRRAAAPQPWLRSSHRGAGLAVRAQAVLQTRS
jgi:hypothetical protein